MSYPKEGGISVKNKEAVYAGRMKTAAVLGMIFAVCDFIFTAIVTHSFLYTSLLQDALLIVCLIFMLHAYDKHDKNLMNSMAGAVLMALLLLQMQYAAQIDTEAGTVQLLHGIVDLVLMIVLLAAFLNHLSTTFRHNRSAAQVTLGRALLWVAAALAAAQIVLCILLVREFVYFLNWSAWYFMLVFILAALVAMERQLNVFKTAKEAGK